MPLWVATLVHPCQCMCWATESLHGVCYQHGAIVDRCRVDGCVIDRLWKEESARSINRWLTFCLKRSMIVQDVPLMDAITTPAGGGICQKHHGGKQITFWCSVDGCSSYAKRLGFCWRHRTKEPCLVEWCDNIAIVRGCCKRHNESNIYSKESNNSTTKAMDSEQQPQNCEPLVCLASVLTNCLIKQTNLYYFRYCKAD